MNGPTCRTCPAYSSIYTQCRFDPPMDVGSGEELIWRFPEVGPSWWCIRHPARAPLMAPADITVVQCGPTEDEAPTLDLVEEVPQTLESPAGPKADPRRFSSYSLTALVQTLSIAVSGVQVWPAVGAHRAHVRLYSNLGRAVDPDTLKALIEELGIRGERLPDD